MQVTLTLNEYELTQVIQDGTLQALSQSVIGGKKQQTAYIKQGLMENEALKSPVSEKNPVKDKTPAEAPETATDKKTEATTAASKGGDITNNDPPFEADKKEDLTSEVTLEEVRAELAKLTKARKNAEVKALFEKYGAKKLTDVDKKHYAALLAEAKEI